MKKKELKVGTLVRVKNDWYSYEGTITKITESTGERKGTLYEVGLNNYFFEEDLIPLAMPSEYEHIATEMLRRDCYGEDKRIIQIAIDNHNFNFTKDGDKIKVSIDAFGKHFEKSYALDEIKYQFNNWAMKNQPSHIWATRNYIHRFNVGDIVTVVSATDEFVSMYGKTAR